MEERELEGAELDAAVALALGWKHPGAIGTTEDSGVKGVPWCLSGSNDWWQTPKGEHVCGPCCGYPRAYSTEWNEGGPIIESERIEISFMGAGHGWQAAVNPESQADWQIPWHDGPTPLIAAMRALVESKKAHVSSHT